MFFSKNENIDMTHSLLRDKLSERINSDDLKKEILDEIHGDQDNHFFKETRFISDDIVWELVDNYFTGFGFVFTKTRGFDGHPQMGMKWHKQINKIDANFNIVWDFPPVEGKNKSELKQNLFNQITKLN